MIKIEIMATCRPQTAIFHNISHWLSMCKVNWNERKRHVDMWSGLSVLFQFFKAWLAFTTVQMLSLLTRIASKLL